MQLGPDPKGPPYVVVGIVGDVRQDGFDAQPRPIAYTSYRQEGQSYMILLTKTTGDPLRLLATFRAAVREIDRTLPITSVTTMEQVAGNSLARRRFSMLLLSIFAAVSLVLAVVGTYGVMAYTVSARTPELGVRIALGATTSNVLGLVVRQSMTTSALGIGIGVIAAVLLAKAIRGLLYGVEPTDVTTFIAVIMLLLGASILAAFVPARRATHIDPIEALRRD